MAMSEKEYASIPKGIGGDLRACLLCSLIKHFDQFESEGCDNCDEFLQMKGNREAVYDCTSANFEGMIAMMEPEDSWVAKWQRISKCCKGMYAISVQGKLPQSIVRDLTLAGVKVVTRDVSQDLGSKK